MCWPTQNDKQIDRNLDTLDDVKKNKKKRTELSFDLAARFYRQSFLFSSCSAQLVLGPSCKCAARLFDCASAVPTCSNYLFPGHRENKTSETNKQGFFSCSKAFPPNSQTHFAHESEPMWAGTKLQAALMLSAAFEHPVCAFDATQCELWMKALWMKALWRRTLKRRTLRREDQWVTLKRHHGWTAWCRHHGHQVLLWGEFILIFWEPLLG